MRLFIFRNIGALWVPLSTPLDRQHHLEVEPSFEVSCGTFADPADVHFTGVDKRDLHEIQLAYEEER